ncbi:MAG: hypothetical protein GOU99_03080, partial [Candidatus Altiarchaeota archaeon]|nr:hypothetical protein [Candidatus Altiarchaeota archaeon]
MVAELFVGRPFTGVFWGLEAVHSIAIAVICFLIYFKTRELQELSLHKGIGSFRKTFLFFGLASITKLLTRHLVISFFLYPGILGIADIIVALGVVAVIYAHTMAAFYLLYSVLWKDQTGLKSRPAMLHAAAVLIAILVGFTSLSSFYFVFQLFLIAYSIG